MSEPLDIAVDLGAVPPALPEMVALKQFRATPCPAPPQLIHGVLHQGSKMILGATSKSNKSWCLLDLGLSVASGQEWWGQRCAQARVAYLNFELAPWAIKERINALSLARPVFNQIEDSFDLWNLRGHNSDISLLRPKLEEQLSRRDYGLIILDPAYKLLGNRDENANGEIASLMNEFEALAQRTSAAVVLAHHFAKGDSTAKTAIDRMSGAGAWARDPDSIVTMTRHEEEDCFTVNMTLRNLPQVPEFVVAWEYPLMRLAPELNPEALHRPQSKNKVCTDREFAEAVLGSDAKSYKAVITQAREVFDMSEASAKRYLARGKESGLICHSAGLYWLGKQEVATK